jgi:hypothetical protein
MSQPELDSRPGSIFVANETRSPGLVLLCPVTRSGDEAVLCWERIISTIANSTVHALVVIDKTKTGEASEYFSRKIASIKARLFVIRRDPGEQIFDSQKFIRLDDLLWIGQLHDDDHWEGNLRLPASGIERNDLFLCGLAMNTDGRLTRPPEDQMPPARVVFSWIPSRLWNRVCDFIYAQGGHIAGSVDFTIAMIALLSCRKRHAKDFTYIFSNHHWGSRSEAEDHLRKLAVVDGWREFSGSDIAILNRTLDNISALIFFGDFVSPEDASLAHAKLMTAFRPSLRKRLLVTCQLRVSSVLVMPILTALESSRLSIGREATRRKLLETRSACRLNQLIVSSWSVRTNEDIVTLIQEHLSPSQFPVLSRRFQFWQEQIGSRTCVR